MMEFYGLIEHHRHPLAWEKSKKGWSLINPIWEQEEHGITDKNIIFTDDYRKFIF